MKSSIIIAVIFMLAPMLSWASFSSAMKSYDQEDYYSAQKEFKKLAAANDSDAQYMLGYMYAVGKGVLQDYTEAHKWFNIAASRGNSEAINARKEVERNMTREQIALSQKKARQWAPGSYKKPTLSSQEIKRNKPATVEIKDKETTRQVQAKLAQLGYKPGVADGALGANSRKAIRQYQRDNNLAVNGKLTQNVVDSLFPNGMVKSNNKKSSSQGLLFPNIWKNSGSKEETAKKHKKLLADLTRLLEQGRQRRAAKSWFLDDLASLINQDQSKWSTMILNDNFDDGDFTSSPKWSVHSGSFDVNKNGLYSKMTGQNQVEEPQQGSENFSTAILGAIIEHATRDKNQTTQPKNNKPGLAKISTNQTIPNSFAMKARLSFHSKNGRIEFGPYSGLKAGSQQGYQLLISPEQNLVELLRTDGRSSSVIESQRKHININKIHTIEWLRNAKGKSTIAMDGKELFKVADRRYKDKFSGFMLNNFSSAVTLHDIKIVAKKKN